MSMALMVAMASRKRDEQGRYAEGDEMRRMSNDHSTHMGGEYSRRMEDQPEMRRRRDDRGRYMEEPESPRMTTRDPEAHHPWPEPHMPPYLEDRRMEGSRMEHEPDRMRDRNIVSFRDYQDRRQLIGFGMNDDRGDEMRQYGRRYDPSRMVADHDRHRDQEMGYAEGGEGGEHLTREQAEKWVKGMKSEDGKPGPRWPYQEIKQYAGNFGIQGEEQVIEFFAVMNALYSDYCKVAKKYGVDKVDFWADLAKAFMHDKDAEPGKVALYYECIAKHDD